jgi:Asp-tRNA(Asn)/Glu-tRNA(Gln) amidotransferase A subunit family amidase
MNKANVPYSSAVDLKQMIVNQEISALDLVEIFIERIKKINPIINAYCTTTFNLAREAAKLTDKKNSKGDKLGLIEGIPTSIKDLTDMKGIRTTYGSKIFENHIPKRDDIVVRRLKSEGAVILGKTNTPEFGHKGMTDNLIFGVSRNPWNLETTPGGSTGGGAAATAAGISVLTQGSDGGGSIRIPSSFCGIYGIKPTFGRVPQTSMQKEGNFGTLVQKGPMTRFVEDAALMLDVMVGPDDIDRYSLPKPNLSFFDGLKNEENKLSIGYSMDLGFVKAIHPEVKDAFLDSVQKFENFGWKVDKSSISIENSANVHGIMWFVGLKQYIGPYEEKWVDSITPSLKRMLKLSANIDVSRVTWAEVTREKIYDEVCKHFKNYDILITPTLSVPSLDIDTQRLDTIDGIDVSKNPIAWQPTTHVFNLTGHPAASIPCGWSKDGSPIGMTIVGRRFDELSVLRASKIFEELAPWQDKHPNL